MAKDIPYGVSDFVNVIRNNKYYVDKTMFIPELEKAGNFLSLVRPRRFGKSLLLSMLAAYYLVAPEVELDHGFCDFFFLPDHIRYADVAHSYILELKYLPAKDFDAKNEAQWQC